MNICSSPQVVADWQSSRYRTIAARRHLPFCLSFIFATPKITYENPYLQ